MFDDKAAASTDQDQVKPTVDSYSTNPSYSTTSANSNGDPNPSSQPAQSTPGLNQSSQVSPAPEPVLTNDSSFTETDDSKLEDIKRTALQDLLPIVDKLDQPPEERFQTLLMVIQASDNRELIDEAYKTAAKIQDDGKRAQALLAVINEINFFTQQPAQN